MPCSVSGPKLSRLRACERSQIRYSAARPRLSWACSPAGTSTLSLRTLSLRSASGCAWRASAGAAREACAPACAATRCDPRRRSCATRRGCRLRPSVLHRRRVARRGRGGAPAWTRVALRGWLLPLGRASRGLLRLSRARLRLVGLARRRTARPRRLRAGRDRHAWASSERRRRKGDQSQTSARWRTW